VDATLRTITWQQFGAAIDMLDNAVRACPDAIWTDRSQQPEFWYVAYHTLFWLDLYLSGSVEGFAPPAPFGLEELDPAGLLPERPYTKDELRTYLQHCRRKCRETIDALTDAKAAQPCRLSRGEISFLELLLYNMRHVQEHAAQLSLILGQRVGWAAEWVPQAKSESTGVDPAPNDPAWNQPDGGARAT
jgi:hypothetical protein